MKVNFTGNYLYTFKNYETREKAIKATIKKQNDLAGQCGFEGPSRVFRINDDKMLYLNGEDCRDYQRAKMFESDINIDSDGTILALAEKSVKIDLSYKNLNPRYYRES